MADIREILVDWTTASGPGKVSVFWFEAVPSVISQRTALSVFLGAIDGFLDNGTQWVIRTSGRQVESTTGALTGVWTEATGFGGIGGGTGEPVADSTQVLIRWKTSTIVNGRFLQGRTFIPGLSTAYEIAGNLSSAAQSSMASDAQTLATSAANLHVWHRPTSGTGGTSVDVSTGTVWSELAVLRRRRA